MPLGLWEGGAWSPTSGFHFPARGVSPTPLDIVVDLGRDYPIDRIHLLPLECPLVPGVAIMPCNYELALTPQDSDEGQPVAEIQNQSRPIREITAQVIETHGKTARFVRLTCNGVNRRFAAKNIAPGLAEIEVYSKGRNVADGAAVRAWLGGKNITEETDALTDGFTSRRKSIPLKTWLIEVAEHARLDRERVYQSICAGASGYLLKTAEPDEILSGIRDVINGAGAISPSIAKMILQGFAKLGPVDDVEPLTHREEQVLFHLVQGFIKKEIADHLNISLHTVDMHLRSIYRKLHVNTQTEAVSKAIRRGIV